MIIHKSFSDFVLFLYVHMAMIDGRVHDTEENVILSKMDNLFPPNKSKGLVLNQAIQEYRTTNHEMIFAIIKESFDYFEEAKQNREKIYRDMFDIINADGVVDGSETKELAVLNQIIHLTSVSG